MALRALGHGCWLMEWDGGRSGMIVSQGLFGTGTSDRFVFLTRLQFIHLLHGRLTNLIEPLDSGSAFRRIGIPSLHSRERHPRTPSRALGHTDKDVPDGGGLGKDCSKWEKAPEGGAYG